MKRKKVDWIVLRNGNPDAKDFRTHYAVCKRCQREYDLSSFFPISLEGLSRMFKFLVAEHRECALKEEDKS